MTLSPGEYQYATQRLTLYCCKSCGHQGETPGKKRPGEWRCASCKTRYPVPRLPRERKGENR